MLSRVHLPSAAVASDYQLRHWQTTGVCQIVCYLWPLTLSLRLKSFKFLQNKHAVSWTAGGPQCIFLVLTWRDRASAMPSIARLSVDSLGFNDAGGLTPEWRPSGHVSVPATGRSSHWALGQQLWGRWIWCRKDTATAFTLASHHSLIY